MPDDKPSPKPPELTVIDPVSMEHVVLTLSPDVQKPNVEHDGEKYTYTVAGSDLKVHASAELVEEKRLTPPCPVCACEHIYRQRDFNRNLGLTIVVLFALCGLIASAIQGTILPLILLLILASVVDLAIYSCLPDVAVCYRCLTCFREVEIGESIEAYDQHVADAFEFPAES